MTAGRDDRGLDVVAGASSGPAFAPSRRSEIPSFMVMDVMREAARLEALGRSVLHMEVGQPGTPAPAAAREAVRRALETQSLGYTLALGTEALRERIAAYYRDVYGVAVEPERVVVTMGSSGAFILAFLAIFDAGASVALPSPGYPCYRHILSALGVSSRLIETGPDDGWMPTPETLEAAHRARRLEGFLVASPANPTGTMLSPERLAALASVCERHGIWLVSDEIYHGLTYVRPADTALRHAENAIVINSFSKYFSMTGWRVGWMVVPAALVRTIERLAQNLFISPPAVAQVAALGAFDGLDELEANRCVYADNREVVLAALTRAGLTRVAPADGAFYVYADVGHITTDSRDLAARLLAETGVAATPGVDFDEERGSRFLRLSYAGSREAVLEAMRRLERWPGLSQAVR